MRPLNAKQKAALRQFAEQGHFDGVHGQTVNALKRRKLIEPEGKGYRLLDQSKSVVGEAIGKLRPNNLRFRYIWRNGLRKTFDVGQPDYELLDRIRRGNSVGYLLAGLFAKPLASKKAAWVLGAAPVVKMTDNDDATRKFEQWLERNFAKILLAMEEAVALGDAYVVINPDEDLSVTIVPPHVVEPIVDERDFSQQIGWRIVQTYERPDEVYKTQTRVDEWTATRRVTTIYQNGGQVSRRVRRNLLGRVPIIHIKNNPDSNSLFGHAEIEPMLEAMQRYDETLATSQDVFMQAGHPMVAFENMGTPEAVEAFMAQYAEETTETNPFTGESAPVRTVNIGAGDIPVLGGTGRMAFKQPSPFTGDMMNLLQMLFYLFLQHTEIPEFVWGNAIASSKASAEAQMPTFLRWVEKERGRAAEWFRQAVEIVLTYWQLVDPLLAPNDQEFVLQWPSLTESGDETTIKALELGFRSGALPPSEITKLLPLGLDQEEIDRIVGLIKDAQDEQDRRDRGLDDDFTAEPPAPTDDAEDDAEGADADERQLTTIIKEGYETSVMIAFDVPLDTAAMLTNAARDAGMKKPMAPEDMHLTLAYIGDMTDLPEDGKQRIKQACRSVASWVGMSGKIGGVGRFNASANSNDKDVIYASYDCPRLADFRERLVSMLSMYGVKVNRAHGFTPHITLGYVSKDERYDVQIETTRLSVDRITLYWGNERTTFRLGERTFTEAEQTGSAHVR